MILSNRILRIVAVIVSCLVSRIDGQFDQNTRSSTTTASSSCNICGAGNTIGKPDGIVIFEFPRGIRSKKKCSKLQTLIDTNNFQGLFLDFCFTQLPDLAAGPCDCTPVIVPTVRAGFGSALGGVVDSISNTVSNAVDNIKNQTTIDDSVSNIFNNVTDTLNHTSIDDVKNNVTNAVDGLTGNMTLDNVTNTVDNYLPGNLTTDNITNTVDNYLPNNITDAVGNLVPGSGNTTTSDGVDNNTAIPTTTTTTTASEDGSGVVRVVLVAGQGNCAGMAYRSHLQELFSSGDSSYSQYGNASVVGEDNVTNLITRKDASVVVESNTRSQEHGPLFPKFGNTSEQFGIEMGTGYTLGNNYTDPILFIKYCEEASLLNGGGWFPPHTASANGGEAYSRALELYRHVLDNITVYVESSSNNNASTTTEFEITSFVWFQTLGQADKGINQAAVDVEIENLLRAMDQFVYDAYNQTIQSQIIVQSGGTGTSDITPSERTVRNAQACVAENRIPAPQWDITTANGTSFSIDTTKKRALVVTTDYTGGESINNVTANYYYGRADNYIKIGNAIGTTILDVLSGTYVPTTLCTGTSLDNTNSTDSPQTTATGYPSDTVSDSPSDSPTSNNGGGGGGDGNDVSDVPSLSPSYVAGEPTPAPQGPVRPSITFDYFINQILPRLLKRIHKILSKMFGRHQNDD